MSNYNKSFNFRNGVQVDEDDLIVRGSLVGIGTTIPRSELDVRGNLEVSGLVTTTNLYSSGIATFSTVTVGTGITLYGSTGIISATFYGDGSNLFNIPTSQWVDVDPGFGFTSIYAAGNVGVATTNPSASFQVGGRSENGDPGVGISSDGNINATGIITGGFLVGSGANITNINASNVSSGTLNASRLPSDIGISGIATIATLNAAQINNSGIATISQLSAGQINVSGFSTLNSVSIGNVTVSGGSTIGFASIRTAILGNSLITGVATFQSNVYLGDNDTLYFGDGNDLSIYHDGTNTQIYNQGTGSLKIRSTSVAIENSAGIETGILFSQDGKVELYYDNQRKLETTVDGILISGNLELSNSLNITGVSTVGVLTASSVYAGVGTFTTLSTPNLLATKAYVGDVRIAYAATNQIDTAYQNLVLSSATGLTVVDDNLSVTGIATVNGPLTINDSIIPDESLGATLGTGNTYFGSAYIGDVNVGAAVSNEINTRYNDLVLDSSTNLVKVSDRFYVTGISTFAEDVTVNANLVPNADVDGSSLGTGTTYFSSAYVGEINIGVAGSNTFSTRSNNLILDSATGTTQVNDNLNVSQNLTVTGLSYFTGIATVADSLVPDIDQQAALGSSSLRFSDAYVDNIRIGVGSDNEVSTGSGNLKLNSESGVVEVANKLNVSGDTYLTGISTVEIGLLPDADKSGYLGQSSKAFTEAYINEIRIGVGGTTEIDTRTGNLSLDSQGGLVNVNDNLLVNGSATLTGDVNVGTDGKVLFVDETNNRIGIGTSSLSNDIAILRNGNLNVELVSETGTALVAIGQSLGIGNQSATISYDNESLAISNNSDTGSINVNLSSGSGINTTATFNVNHKGVSLVSVGYSGVVGINKNNPSSALDIVGNLAVAGNATVTGSLVIGSGPTQFTLGSGVFGTDIVSSGISTFTQVEIIDKVSIGSTLSVTAGIGSFSEGIGVGTGRRIGSSKLSVVGDYTGDGSILLLDGANKIGIGTTAFQSDTRNLAPGGVDSGYPGIGYGNLQVFGSSTFFGDSTTFLYSGGLLDNSSLDLKYYDTRALTDSRYQANIGINTYIPRSSLDAGCSGGYFIPPSHIESTKQNFIDNPLNNSFYNIGAVVPGATIFYEPKNRLEVGIGTTGAFCGIATLTYNGSGLDAFVPPKLTTAERTTLTNGGIPDGAIIYNTSTNKLQLRASGAWVDLN